MNNNEKVNFELKEEHIKMISHLNFKTSVWMKESDDDKFLPEIDCKRPFGNSGIASSVLELLECEHGENGYYRQKDIDKAVQLVIELPVALKIVTQQHTFEPGVYEVAECGTYYNYRHIKNYNALKEPLKECETTLSSMENYDSQIKSLHEVCMNLTANNPFARAIEELESFNQTPFLEEAIKILKKAAIDKWLGEHDGEDYCQYCDYGCETIGVVPDGNGNPIFPPCADWEDKDVLEYIDTDAILRDIMEEELDD